MTVAEFIAKWKRSDLKERSAAQEHFIDLCRLVGQRTMQEDGRAVEAERREQNP